jgi:drug/metabolite transporter (DMT)-like permease
MTSLRHLIWFFSLGLFWGISPSLYKHWGEIGMPASHVIVMTGAGVALVLGLMAIHRHGALEWGREIQFYGLGCAILINVPFALGIVIARHVPPTELALAISTSPLVNYALALATGRSSATPKRLMAIVLGIVSTGILILSRKGGFSAGLSGWMGLTFTMPFLYAAYSWFGARRWPKTGDTLSVGTWESVWSAVVALPALLLLAPPWAATQPGPWAYWTVAAATLMWIVERIAYFTLIKEKGAVYTVQAVYISTPAAVIIAAAFFGGAYDAWLWLSLAILMTALWLNNSGEAAKLQTA